MGIPVSVPSIGSGNDRSIAAGLLLLFIHTVLVAWCAYRQSPTLNEVGHVPGGLAIWQHGRFDLYQVNPPLPRALAALPLILVPHKTNWRHFTDAPGVRPEWVVGADFIRANGERSFWLFTLARWACIPFSVLGGITCWLWSRILFGKRAGLISLSLWCFCPNLIGNAGIATPDVPAASLGLFAAFTFWRWLRQPTWVTALMAGGALGLAELTKFSWIILFALWPTIWVAVRSLASRSTGAFETADNGCEPVGLVNPALGENNPPLAQLAAILLAGVYVLNVAYGFDGSFQRLDQFPFFSQTLAGGDLKIRGSDPPGNRFRETWCGALPIPLPYRYVTGLDLQKHDLEVAKMSYLRGEFKKGGWWYYYIYATVVKMPTGTLLLAFLSVLMTVSGRTRLPLRDSLPLVIPPLVLFVLVSSQTGFNRYFRYVVPALPFLFVWIGRVGVLTSLGDSRMPTTRWRRSFYGRFACASALVWFLCSSLSVWPHSLSYFNELAGGPRHGHDHLIDANIDWGQDFLYLKEWIAVHPEARPMTLLYKGAFDPVIAGLSFPRTPGFRPPESGVTHRDEPIQKPGWHAVSVMHLRQPDHEFDYLREFEPAYFAGYSIYVYYLSNEDVARINAR